MKSLRARLAAAGLCALIASGALAAGSGAAVRSALPSELVIPSGGSGAAVGTCPDGTRVVSGGFDAPGFKMDGPTVVRTTSTRAGKRAWRTDASGLSDRGGDGSIVTYAYCEPTRRRGVKAPPIRVRTGQSVVSINAIGKATATCRRGERAISGGFAAPTFGLLGGSHVITLTSRRAGKRSWYVEAANFSFDGSGLTPPGELVAYVYCRKGGPKVTASVAEGNVSGNESTAVEAFCPAGTKAISGGFAANFRPVQGGMTASGAIASSRLPLANGWRTSAISVSDGAPATATAFAYCSR